MKLEGKQLGSWKLISRLGKGGNSEVWKAKNSNGQSAAIKVLRTKKGTSSQFKRFKFETEFLQGFGDKPGLLPILGVSLPETPSDETPAWFAMPIAIPIRKALGENPNLETVVEAIRDIARTLASLAEENISHRDIKPDNLYRYEASWAVGDFGLVSYPDKEATTAGGKKLGPLYFIAPEMLSNPESALGPPADLYSLMKTLWVLATGQTFPPPGQQRIEIPAHTLSAFVDNARAKLLDRLLENTTADEPNSRPSITEVEIELTSWLNPKSVHSTFSDLSDLSNRISASAIPRRRLAAQKHVMEEEHTKFVDSIMRKMVPLSGQIAETLGIGQLGFQIPMEVAGAIEVSRQHDDERLADDRDVTIITKGGFATRAAIPGNHHVSLLSGIRTTLYDDGIIGLEAAHFVSLMAPEDLCPPTMIWSVNSGIELVWYGYDETRLGSAHMENVTVEMVAKLVENLRPAIELFTELLETR